MIPLVIGKSYTLSESEVLPHLLKYGVNNVATSNLECYADSYFTITYLRPSKTYSGELEFPSDDPRSYSYSPATYIVTRHIGPITY